MAPVSEPRDLHQRHQEVGEAEDNHAAAAAAAAAARAGSLKWRHTDNCNVV